jgi:hypothetical protein
MCLETIDKVIDQCSRNPRERWDDDRKEDSSDEAKIHGPGGDGANAVEALAPPSKYQ